MIGRLYAWVLGQSSELAEMQQRVRNAEGTEASAAERLRTTASIQTYRDESTKQVLEGLLARLKAKKQP